MLRLALRHRRGFENGCCADPVRGADLDDLRCPVGERTGLVLHNGIQRSEPFEQKLLYGGNADGFAFNKTVRLRTMSSQTLRTSSSVGFFGISYFTRGI